MNITLKDGSVLTVEQNSTCYDIAKQISEGLARNAVCAKVNGKLVDLSEPVTEDSSVEIVTLKDKEGLDVYRHTCSHVLAQAVKAVFPTCHLAIGPVIENGFYYDFYRRFFENRRRNEENHQGGFQNREVRTSERRSNKAYEEI